MAAGIDVISLARVKALLKLNTGDKDDFLNDAIDAVSEEFETYLDSPLLQGTLTEEYDVQPRQHHFDLRAKPVDSITTIITKSDHKFAEGTPIDVDAFHFDPETGELEIESGLFVGFRTLQIVYVAGFATDTADLETNFPTIARAAELQVTHEYRRLGHEGGQSVKQGQSSRSYFGQLDLLKRVSTLLSVHRRLVFL